MRLDLNSGLRYDLTILSDYYYFFYILRKVRMNTTINRVYVHTLGDSTLDNVYWMLDSDGKNIQEAKAQSVEGQLKAKLSDAGDRTYKVVSHAYAWIYHLLIDR